MGCLLLYPFQSLAANIDVELRVGAETVCLTCPDNTFPWKTHPTGQLFTDLLFPVPSFESLEFGPYIKLALFSKDVTVSLIRNPRGLSCANLFVTSVPDSD